MGNKDWREQFLKIHYEPEHEKGQTCWCMPKTIVTDGIAEIIHNEQRVVLVSIIESLLKSKQEEIEKSIDEMKGYVPHLPTIDPSLGELTDQDIDFVEHIDGQILFKSKVKPIISNILK